MKKHWKIWGYTLPLFAALFMTACNKPDFKKVAGGTWNPNAAAPIGHAEFGVYDILASQDSNDLIVINPVEGDLALEYHGEIASFDAQTILQLSNYNQQFGLLTSDLGLSPAGSFNGSISSSNSQPLNFPTTGGTILNSVTLESGTMDISLSSTLKHDIIVFLTFPDLLDNGNPITRTLSVNYNGSVPLNANTSVDLADVLGDFTANGTGTNTLRVDIDATINGTGQDIAGNENLDIDVNLNNLKFLNATGYFGQQNIASASDSILLKIFNTASTGTFQFTNPTLNFRVENSFGIPVQLDITNLKSINTVSGAITNLTNNNLSNILVTSPASFGQMEVTNIPELNTGNTTNMNSLVSNTPKYLNYTINAISNPSGQTGTLNFIEKSSKMVVKADLELPLEGFAYNFTLTDTLPFNFNEDPEMVESALIRLNTTNGFPINFMAQASFVDSNNVVLFNIFGSAQELLSAAPVDANGKVTSRINKITDITLSKPQINLLDQVDKVIITGTAATTQPQSTIVKIYDSYKLSLKLGMQVSVKQNFAM